jgi:hypothetical protein
MPVARFLFPPPTDLFTRFHSLPFKEFPMLLIEQIKADCLAARKVRGSVSVSS